MKRFVKFTIHEADSESEICGRNAPKKVLSEMRSRWPQFFPAELVGFHLRAELDHPVIDEVISYLRTTGREPHWNKRPSLPYEHPTLYQIEGERVWEQSDFDNASYFAWMVDVLAGSGRMLHLMAVSRSSTFETNPLDAWT